MVPGKNPYSQDKKTIAVDKPKEPITEPRESPTKGTMTTFSIRLPQEQKERLEGFLDREKGQKIGPFVRQLITEYMRKERIW